MLPDPTTYQRIYLSLSELSEVLGCIFLKNFLHVECVEVAYAYGVDRQLDDIAAVSAFVRLLSAGPNPGVDEAL